MPILDKRYSDWDHRNRTWRARAIAGIVIGTIVAILLLLALTVARRRRARRVFAVAPGLPPHQHNSTRPMFGAQKPEYYPSGSYPMQGPAIPQQQFQGSATNAPAPPPPYTPPPTQSGNAKQEQGNSNNPTQTQYTPPPGPPPPAHHNSHWENRYSPPPGPPPQQQNLNQSAQDNNAGPFVGGFRT